MLERATEGAGTRRRLDAGGEAARAAPLEGVVRLLVVVQQVAVRPEEVARDVVVERLLLGLHRVLEGARAAVDEGATHEGLGLPAERALDDLAHAPLELVGGAGGEAAIALGREDGAEGRQIAEERARRVDELDEAPELGERVLDRRRRQQEHGGRPEGLLHAAGDLRVGRVGLVAAARVVATPDAGEHLVGLVDDDEQALVAGHLHHLEDAVEVGQRGLAADVALDAVEKASDPEACRNGIIQTYQFPERGIKFSRRCARAGLWLLSGRQAAERRLNFLKCAWKLVEV